MSSRAIYGGSDGKQWGLQRDAVDAGADILVATPGRLLQFINLGIAALKSIDTLILDEADRMMDMGFLPDIKKIVAQLPQARQTLFFSATMPKEVRKLSEKILRDPASINIEVSKPAENIRQYKLLLDEVAKIPVLSKFLQLREDLQSIIIFAERKITVRELTRALQRAKLDVVEIQSDLDQHEREEALQRFRTHQARIMVATDIVARGIDIEEVQMVINFNVPSSYESYVHRVGRTARAASKGESLTLCAVKENGLIRDIERKLESSIDMLPELEGLEIPPISESAERGGEKENGRKNTGGRNRKRTQPRGEAQRGQGKKDSEGRKEGQKRKRKPTKPKTQSDAAPEEVAAKSETGQAKAKRKPRPRRRPASKKTEGNGGEVPKTSESQNEEGRS